MTPRLFLSAKETKQLTDRIASFEKSVGCELVFHFRRKLGPDPENANKALFHKFKLHETSDHRAILITLALQEKKFAVWVDEGVEKHGGQILHDNIGKHLKEHLSQSRHLEALLGVVDIAEKALKNSKSSSHKANEIPNEPIIEDREES